MDIICISLIPRFEISYNTSISLYFLFQFLTIQPITISVYYFDAHNHTTRKFIYYFGRVLSSEYTYKSILQLHYSHVRLYCKLFLHFTKDHRKNTVESVIIKIKHANTIMMYFV